MAVRHGGSVKAGLVYPSVGTYGLLTERSDTIKVGAVNISGQDVEAALDSVLECPFYALKLEGKDKSLKEALFSKTIGFSGVKDVLSVSVDKSEHLQLSSFIGGDLNVPYFHEKLKDCVVAFFGVGTTVEEPGSSTEDHKAAVRTALTLLSPNGLVIISDEITFEPTSGFKGPHGVLDILIGSRQKDGNDHQNCVVVFGDQRIRLVDVALAESKSRNTSLAAVRLSNDLSDDLAAVAQPVVQLATVAQVVEQEPFVLFYSTREMVRPFVYYRSCDVMLAPSYSVRWMNVSEHKLELEGMMMMAVLMQSSKLIDLSKGLTAANVKKTGFKDAIKSAGESTHYSVATLKPQVIPDEQHPSKKKRPNPPPQGRNLSDLVRSKNV